MSPRLADIVVDHAHVRKNHGGGVGIEIVVVDRAIERNDREDRVRDHVIVRSDPDHVIENDDRVQRKRLNDLEN